MTAGETSYRDFVATKRKRAEHVGFEADNMHPSMFAHQRCIVQWACRVGRAGVFADTGLGKTRIQLQWAREVARHTGGRVLVLAPLAVGDQTRAECVDLWGDHDAIDIVNYERLHKVDAGAYAGVVLDESSILKAFDGRTRTQIIDAFRATPYRLACTATPSPNDHTELGNHAEFLGVCTYAEMLAEYFVHDTGKGGGASNAWRLKGHAVAAFWQWVSSWAVVIRRPSDLGYDDAGYDLPPLRTHSVTVAAPRQDLALFATPAMGLHEQRQVRRATIDGRCKAAAEIASQPGACIVWCELNDESAAVARAVADAIEVTGSDDLEDKRAKLMAFADGDARVIVTKASIAGFGLNWQHCSRMVFVGSTHSFEQYYQAVRRCWRFGQTRPVDVHIIRTDADDAITSNLARKIEQFDSMGREVADSVRDSQLESLRGIRPGAPTQPTKRTVIPSWLRSH